MDDPRDRDWLDDLLSQSATPIEDAGFTEKVVKALPPRPVGDRVRNAIILTCTVVAGLVGFLVLPSGAYLIESVQSLLSPENGISLVTHLILLATLAVLVWMPLTLAREET